ncbi:hypothetical protein Cob_v001345 [Colletotrichum orbiculare MAFF 240422]|uniref:Uncharacterized protein n=1 Tax=Colletotrichum orbiculare (strain 104-T / ATCC 96160 / CBS 514.97 / LARS 414 / MAFF 240422) TaxID=1213857 RepID=A0A484G9M6_COLOR|nr:hypothetical protein Cob_v001345 [Colletotrichum orbiculare MAFF 240422]
MNRRQRAHPRSVELLTVVVLEGVGYPTNCLVLACSCAVYYLDHLKHRIFPNLWPGFCVLPCFVSDKTRDEEINSSFIVLSGR